MFLKNLFYVCLCLFVFMSLSISHAQTMYMGTKVITEPAEIARLKSLIGAYKKLTREREACYKGPQDRQKCVCDKYQDYIDFDTYLNDTIDQYPEWYEYVLVFEDQGRKRRTSFETFLYGNSPDNYLYAHCWFPKTGGPAKAIHNKEESVLKLFSKEDIYDIRRLRSYYKKVQSDFQACARAGYSNIECKCSQEEGYDLLERVFYLTKEKHPDWEYKILQFSHKNTGGSLAFNAYERAIMRYKNDCAKTGEQ